MNSDRLTDIMRQAGFYTLDKATADRALDILDRTYRPRVRTDATLIAALTIAVQLAKAPQKVAANG
jgi:hypothetical protein